EELSVWMSHGDQIDALPPGMRVIAESGNSPACAVADRARRFYGVQFHPEVAHTPRGAEILGNFLFRICGCTPTWTMASFAEQAMQKIKHQVGERGRVVCALSGGVDSSVTAALVGRAVGDRLTCIFVDNGVLRAGEAQSVEAVFRREFHMDLRVVDAAQRFLAGLSGVVDPERKRKIIGNEFIAVFEDQAQRIGGIEFLAQGTLYPDVIESVSVRGPSVTIKTHHNVG